MEQLLIVEDDIGLNQGLCKALKVDDRKIISCQDLKTAKEQLLCGGVSLILLDINLPDGSGLELLREVKENTPDIPVILLTANDTDLDIVDGLERGADDYITKPFSLSVLRARVNTQLRKQASSHKNAPIHIDLFHFDFEAMGSLSVMTGLSRSFPGRAPQSVSGSFWRAASLPPMWSLQKRQAMNAPSLPQSSGTYITISARMPEKPDICPACQRSKAMGSQRRLIA